MQDDDFDDDAIELAGDEMTDLDPGMDTDLDLEAEIIEVVVARPTGAARAAAPAKPAALPKPKPAVSNAKKAAPPKARKAAPKRAAKKASKKRRARPQRNASSPKRPRRRVARAKPRPRARPRARRQRNAAGSTSFLNGTSRAGCQRPGNLPPVDFDLPLRLRFLTDPSGNFSCSAIGSAERLRGLRCLVRPLGSDARSSSPTAGWVLPSPSSSCCGLSPAWS